MVSLIPAIQFLISKLQKMPIPHFEQPFASMRQFLLFIFLLPMALCAQDTITIGTGTVMNDFFEYPAPYGNAQNGARHQMLVKDIDELGAVSSRRLFSAPVLIAELLKRDFSFQPSEK